MAGKCVRKMPRFSLLRTILHNLHLFSRIYPDPQLSLFPNVFYTEDHLYLIDGSIRKLSPRECANVTGFPKNFILDENKNQCYKQFGNSVVVDVIQNILIEVNKKLS